MTVARQIFVSQANACQEETVIFFTSRGLSQTEELALLVPQVMLLLLQNPTVVNMSVGHWLDRVSKMVISHAGMLRL